VVTGSSRHWGKVSRTHIWSSRSFILFSEASQRPGAARVGQAAVRRFLPDLIKLIWDGKIDPGKVFYVTLPLDADRRGVQGDARAPRD